MTRNNQNKEPGDKTHLRESRISKTVSRFKQWLPSRDFLHQHAALKRLQPFLSHSFLWHFSRHTVPGAFALGLIAAMIPGPIQIVSATFLAIKFRVHLPTAIAATFISNPFTIVPIYWVAYRFGAFLLQITPHSLVELERVAREDLWNLWGALGWPFMVGMPLLTLSAAMLSYFLLQRLWIWQVGYHWRHRHGA